MVTAGQAANPLVRVVLALGGLLAVSLASDQLRLLYTAAIFLALCGLYRYNMVPIFRSIRTMLPWSIIFFSIHLVFFTLTQPDVDFRHAFQSEVIVLGRFIGLSGVMGILREDLQGQNLINSIKTLIDRTGLVSRLAEDGLQMLRLTLFFIPQVGREYEKLERFNRALGIEPGNSLRGRITFYSAHLLPVLEQSLARAHQLGEIMILRGYGTVIPRGQLEPVPFTGLDFLKVIFIMLTLSSSRWVL